MSEFSTFTLLESVTAQIELFLSKNTTTAEAKDLHLDPRAASNHLMVGENFICCRVSERATLDYFGGFEYINKDAITVLGKYVFYSAEDERVRDHLDYYRLISEEE